MTLILTQAQAEAVYSAMCALNNVGARLHVMAARGPQEECLQVLERRNGSVVIGHRVDNEEHGEVLESHADQNAFARTYGLMP